MIKNLLPIFFGEVFWKKTVAYALLFLIGYILRDFLVLFFVTFLFAYIFLEFGTYLALKMYTWGVHGKSDKLHQIAQKYSHANSIITILYIIFIGILIFIFINIIPQIVQELNKLLNSSGEIARQVQEFIRGIEMSMNLNPGLNNIIGEKINASTLESLTKTAITYVTNAGIIFTKFLIALILSYLFIIDRKRIEKFLGKLQFGNFGFLYKEWAILANKIGSGFGLIFRAQSIIALVNAILTTIGLLIISFFHGGTTFPFIFTISLIVFICGFVPVFGTFLSGFPIIILGYGYGAPTQEGLVIVSACIIMIAVVHAVEAYYLNPKIVSSYMHFPVFITLLILLISEHIFGLIGLLIGIPLFSVIIGLINDLDKYINEVKKKIKLISITNE